MELPNPLNSWNPVWANFHYYIDMIKYASKMSSWKDRIKMIFAKPGWLPDELGGYQAPREIDKNAYRKYNTATSKWLNYYVLMQFVFIILGTMAFMHYFPTISTFYKWTFLGVLILSLMICGAIFENKRWVVGAEYIRLLLVIFSLNTFYYYWYLDWFLVMLIASLPVYIFCNLWFTFSWVEFRNKLQTAKAN